MKKTYLPSIQIFLLIALATLSAAAKQVVPRSDVGYWVTNYSTGNGPSGVYLGNIRGKNTWRDLVIANKNDNTVSLRLCRDAGNFNSTETTYAVDAGPVAVIAADLNRDKYDDVVTANFSANTISLLPNKKNNTLGAATNYAVGLTTNAGPVALAFGNASLSGRQDIFVANLNENTVTVFTNSGNCVLTLRTNVAVGVGPMAIAVADFNGDNANDIVTANTNGTLTILQGDNTANFTVYTNITLFEGGDPQPSAISLGDFNRDGKIDIVVANYASNSISIFTNGPGAVFSLAANYDVGTNPRGVLVRDLNRDNILDIVVANENSGNISVFRGNGDGSFESILTNSVGNNPVAVAGSNFNEDGMTDLAVLCYGDNLVSILDYNLPLAFSDTASVYEDTPKTVTVSAQQLNGNPFTYTIVDNPAHGSVTGSGPSFVYTPETNYFGPDSFTFKANDGSNDSATATNTINITAVNDAPSFTLATNVVRAEKFVAQAYTNFVSSNPGGWHETNQVVSYVTLSLGATNIFATRPTIQANGTLNFKPSTVNFGTSTVTIVAQDNGGKNYGGTNRSASQTFMIVNPSSNPFAAAKGTYNGLYSEAGNTTPDTAGAFSFNLSNIGAYSGSVYLHSSHYAFSGQFDIWGDAQSRVVIQSVTNLITLHLDVSNGTDRVTGTISNEFMIADLIGDKYTFDALHPTTQAGKYNVLLPGLPSSAVFPSGDSYATLTVTAPGRVSIAMALADGTTASQSTYLSKNGDVPVFMPLYYGFGILSGWLNLSNQITNSATGTLTWHTGDYYVFGWDNDIAVSGSTYTAPASGTRILNMTNVVITLRDGDLLAPLTVNATLTANNTLIVSNNVNKVSLGISVTSGTISGSFRHPVTLQTSSIRGVVLQQQNKVEGYFRGPNTSGHLEITAP